jgi:transcriptional regulator with XRE-family HTH domain
VPKQTPYTEDELRQALKDRQGGQNLKQYAEEIGVSFTYLSQILLGDRPIGNDRILEYLAPKGMQYVHTDVWYLMPK